MNIPRIPDSSYTRVFLIPLLVSTLSIASGLPLAFAQDAEEEADPAEITNGERLFLETRFAQFFKVFLDGGKTVNDALTDGDPVLDKAVNWQAPSAEHPFKGLSMNCRSCHFVDELGVEEDGTVGYGMRTYSDFARRSPVPAREDGKTVTVRNSPPLVNASLPRRHFFLHFDAEFTTMVDLVKGTLTGRNYGWIAGEGTEAIAHIAKIIREDDGTGDLASSDFEGLPYATMLTGTDPNLPDGFVLPEEFRVDVATATDEEIFQTVAKLIAAYTEDLAFSQDENGSFNLSPYDVFLEKNNLPRQPKRWQSHHSYSKKLLKKIKRLERQGRLQFISENPNFDGDFEFHDQRFVFGEEELQGLKIFFKQKDRRLRPSDLAKGKIGNCIACHAAPNFTDFKFHNTGIAQAEYDRTHGPGTFAQLEIPELWERFLYHDEFLPATEEHPQAQEPFRAIPTTENPQLTDLGLWNIFLNPDFRKPQRRIWINLCEEVLNGNFEYWNIIRKCGPRRLLPRAIALFKTPGLRDLSHSAPYSHTGQADTLEDVIRGYINNSELRREGELRNGDRRLKKIALTENDIVPLVKFLKSLNEDYS